MGFHLPLNRIDQVNQPPLYFLQVQDSLILSVSFFWTIAYVLYIRQGLRDKSYGMPLFALYESPPIHLPSDNFHLPSWI